MNLWAYPLLILWTLIGLLISLPLLFVGQLFSRWPISKTIHLFIWIYARICLLILRPFIRLKLEDVNCENLPNHGIFVINHRSFIDSYMLSMLPVFDMYVWAKAWPFKMPWYSLIMRLAEYIDVESLSWEQILAKAEKIIRKDRFLVVFPEGHRSRTGKQGKFHVGAFKLAVQVNTPICPVCITGTQTLLRPGQFWLKPATIRMRLLSPVFPDRFCGERPHAQMRKYVRDQMIETLERMESEANAD